MLYKYKSIFSLNMILLPSLKTKLTTRFWPLSILFLNLVASFFPDGSDFPGRYWFNYPTPWSCDGHRFQWRIPFLLSFFPQSARDSLKYSIKDTNILCPSKKIAQYQQPMLHKKDIITSDVKMLGDVSYDLPHYCIGDPPQPLRLEVLFRDFRWVLFQVFRWDL